MGWKQRGHGEAFLRLSPPWVIRCAMMEGKANTWPHGVIWGHTGAVSREIGHCTGCVVSMSTWPTKSQIQQ